MSADLRRARSTDFIPCDVEQRVKELRELGFNVSFDFQVSNSNKPYLVVKISKEKHKT